MLSCRNNRRSVVQRWPAVPMAENATPRRVRFRSAVGDTMAALFPPSSSKLRPKRAATRGPTSRPMRVDPVADTSATLELSTRASPKARPPINSWLSPSGACPPAALKRAIARSIIAWAASADRLAFSDGFHTTALPQTSASAVFHDQTATGKLKADITPTTPKGCQVSIMRWLGRSEAIVYPYNCRERPTAKSQISIISCTSPAPSEITLPTSIDTRRPRSALWLRNSSAQSRTNSPRCGAGTVRQAR